MAAMLGVGYYFLRSNASADDYFVGGRNMSAWHIGLSVVATDVGGGFSIGLGGLGFLMGLSGSWMLFTGLIGAWLAAVFLIPKVHELGLTGRLLTFPQIFRSIYGNKVAWAAGLISAIGYLGFTASQMLAGAKLASASFPDISLNTSLWIMGVLAVVYTGMGGIKAVIYTDTIQWALLMGGLILIGIPLSLKAVGGWDVVVETLPEAYFSFTNLTWQDGVNWLITIVPIWFVGMTLYQRIYASSSAKEAKKAWFIAGGFEWPIMAFMGVLLGMFAKVAFQQNMFAELGFPAGSDIDAEMGLPLLLRSVLPVGLMGIMMAAYFSAIMSTADSCLMAASGNIMTDLFKKYFPENGKNNMLKSQVVTVVLGFLALSLASYMTEVLDLMLYSYAFMVSGLLVPLLVALYGKRPKETPALISMVIGGFSTLILTRWADDLPYGLDPIAFGLIASVLAYWFSTKFLTFKFNSQ